MPTILDSFLYAVDIQIDKSKSEYFRKFLIDVALLTGTAKESLQNLGISFEEVAKEADDLNGHIENLGEQAKATEGEVNKLEKSTQGFGQSAKSHAVEGARSLHAGLVNLRYGALALVGAMTGVGAAVALTESRYEKLAYTAQRANSSVTGLQSLAYGVSQQGGTREGALSSAEGLANFLRNPGGASFLQSLGVHATDTSGRLRDTTALLRDLGTTFRGEQSRGVNYATIKGQASVLGIDENTLQALMRGVGQFSTQLEGLYKKVGFNADDASKRAVEFMRTFREFGQTLSTLKDSVVTEMGPEIAAQIKTIREAIVSHFGQIKGTIKSVVKGLLTAGRVILFVFTGGIEIVGDLLEWFGKLPGGIQAVIGAAAGIGTAFAILGGPITLVLGLAGALSTLYLDYKTWRKGGKSFIDWSKWKGDIDNVMAGLKEFKEGFVELFKTFEPVAKRYLEPVIDFLKNYVIETLHRITKNIFGLGKTFNEIAHGQYTDAWNTFKGLAFDSWQDTKTMAGQGWELIKHQASTLATDVGDLGVKAIAGDHGATLKSIGSTLRNVLGTDNNHIAGILGNSLRESGLNPAANNNIAGGHYGLFQWSKERADAIFKGTGIDIMHPTGNYQQDVNNQIQAFLWEVSKGGERGEFSAFLKQRFSSPSEAAVGFNNSFERPEAAERDLLNSGNIKRRKFSEAVLPLLNPQSLVQRNYANYGRQDQPVTHNYTSNITINAPNGDAQAIAKATGEVVDGKLNAFRQAQQIRHSKRKLG
ncbi:phage tail tip lysozyme [Entomobacter blattae]|uniref:Phage tail lysozyme n=1 Tax=Entomobacter blattae TaxID=2762277 RepID=A0A7H1NTT2_9PROT|nr:phage tail tip lysozyme [Entomobacter blattae]QNT79192.1 Phage tail lysozyme [Entomobacter blattae]